MLQVKFVKKPQKHILSFSKVLCAPSGDWLSPLHIFSLVTKKQFKFSNNFALELPPTFCVLNQQPFLLFVKILCALSTDTYSTSSKPVQTVPSLPSHLQRYVWQYFFNTCPKDLRVMCPDAANEAWRGSWVKQIVEAKENEKQRNFFVPASPQGMMLLVQTYVQIRQKKPVVWSFGLLYFTCLPSPSLLACFTRGHKEELILYEELCWTKQYDCEGVFVEREW